MWRRCERCSGFKGAQRKVLTCAFTLEPPVQMNTPGLQFMDMGEPLYVAKIGGQPTGEHWATVCGAGQHHGSSGL